MTPNVLEMMVAGLFPFASEARKSTSTGSSNGEKKRRLPNTLPQPTGDTIRPKLCVSAASLGTFTVQLPPVSVAGLLIVYRLLMSKQYPVNDDGGTEQRVWTFCLLKVKDRAVKPLSGTVICHTSPCVYVALRSGRMLTLHNGAPLQV